MKGKMRRALVALLVATTMLAPSDVSAAAEHLTIEVSPSTLTPDLSGGCGDPLRPPCYRVFGVAPPGVEIVLTVSDDSGAEVIARTFAIAGNGGPRSTPGWTGTEPGDWVLSPNVTNLGTHGDEPSTLTFAASARDDEDSVLAAQTTAVKVAVTPGDVTAPQVRIEDGPPSNWCHIAGPSCSFQENRCVLDTVLVLADIAAGNERGLCSRPRQIKGFVEDAGPDSFGIASEVSQVTIEIIRHLDEVVVKEFPGAFHRGGTRATFAATVSISDYEPGGYDIVVTGLDAWGETDEEIWTFFVQHT